MNAKSQKMYAKSQISLFIVIGVVILTAFLFVFSIGNITVKKESPTTLTELTEYSKSVKFYVDTCLSTILKSGVVEVGFREYDLKDYINNNLNKCINFEDFKGISIQQEPYNADVRISDYNILVNLDYNLTLSKGKSTLTLSEFRDELEYSKSIDINQRATGTLSQVFLQSSNEKAKLIVPKDTKITLNGQAVKNLQISIIDNRVLEDLIRFRTVLPIGHLAYKIMPDKAVIEPNALLTIAYDERLIPNGIREDIHIAVFDDTINQWVVLPTTIDTEKNTLTTNLTHFSHYTPVWRSVSAVIPLGEALNFGGMSPDKLKQYLNERLQPAIPKLYLTGYNSPAAPIPGLGAAQLNPQYNWETKISEAQLGYGNQLPVLWSAFMPLVKGVDPVTGEIIVELIPHTADHTVGWLMAMRGVSPDFKTQLERDAAKMGFDIGPDTKYKIGNEHPALQGKSVDEINKMYVPTYGYASSGNPGPSHSAYDSAMQTVLSIAVTQNNPSGSSGSSPTPSGGSGSDVNGGTGTGTSSTGSGAGSTGSEGTSGSGVGAVGGGVDVGGVGGGI